MTPKKSTLEGLQQKIQEIEEKPRALDQPVSERPGRPSGPDEASFLLEALFNVIPDIIGIQDSDHKIIRYNKAGYRFLNRSQEEVAGRKCYELIGRDSPCEVCATTETYRTKRSARVERYFDELGVWFDVRSYPILNKDGDVFCVIEHLRDITEEKRRESELQESRDLLQKLVAQRTEELSRANDALTAELNARTQMEQKLRASEESLRTLFEEVPIGLYRTDLEGRIVEANPTLVHMLGFPDLESLRKVLSTSLMVKPEVQAEMRRILERKGKIQGWEFELYRWDGSTIWVRDSARAVQDLDGRVYYEGSLEDITERRRAEEALKENEEKYRTVAENSLAGIFIVQDNQFVFVNHRQAELLGYDGPEELVGEPFWEVVHPDHRDMVKENAARRLKGEAVPSHYEFLSLKKDGTPVWGEMRIVLAEYRGRPAIIGNVVDVTERKKAEASTKESEERFRTLFESAPDAYFLHDAEGIILDVNRKAEQLSGHTRNELLGRKIFESLLMLSGHDPLLGPIIERNRQRQNTGPDELELARKDGSTVFVEVRTYPIRVEGNTVTTCVMRDISSKKMAEQEKIQLETRMQQAQKMEAIGTLAGGIAHDFNNILSSIMGFTEMVNVDLPEGSQNKEDLGEVIHACKRARDLVKQILTFSRQADSEMRPLRIDLVVNEALKMIRSSTPTSIEIHQNIKSDIPPVIADPTQVHRIMMNLCTNAVQAIEDEHGTISVSLDSVRVGDLSGEKGKEPQPGEYVHLVISDTGKGISQELQERIFEPYFTTKKAGEGTGLGLSVVYGIVKKAGGTITVESEVGRGATFSVFLPAAEKTDFQEATNQQSSLPWGQEHILFIDDEPSIANLGRKSLERFGYDVTIRQSSLEALELFRNDPNRFDLVVTDMTMPQMTGDELTKEILSIRPGIPIVLCTGYSNRISVEKAKEIGISAFVMKPLTQHELANTVRQVLDEDQ